MVPAVTLHICVMKEPHKNTGCGTEYPKDYRGIPMALLTSVWIVLHTSHTVLSHIISFQFTAHWSLPDSVVKTQINK